MNEVAITRYARFLRIGVLAASALILFLYLNARFGPRIGNVPLLWHSRAANASGSPLVSDGIMLLLAIAIYWLSAALQAIAAGGLFSGLVVRRFRSFALWLLVMALFSFLAPMTLALFRDSSPQAHRVLVIVDIRDLLLVGITALLLLIARMFERARDLDDEMREFV